MPELFPEDQRAGVFRGFSDQGRMEFHADLVLPYQSHFQRIPMHGQFVVVQLETPDEAVLGRITSVSSEGRLVGPSGEDFTTRAMRENRPVPEGLREDYLKYRIDIRVLGVLRRDPGDSLRFVPSHRRLPHVGSPVAFLNGELLRHVAGHYERGADLGFLALGEFVYAHGDDRFSARGGERILAPCTVVRFPVSNLVARRTFVFARAGFGKSNLNKLLFAELYADTPTVSKRGGRQVPVGTIIFDPDGEYFWPDDKGRPGLCDVPHLHDALVVFTSREAPSGFYGSFVAGGIKLDIRRLRPPDVISIALSPEKQDQQNVRKLKGLSDQSWQDLVDLIDRDGHGADLARVKELMRLEEGQDAEALAARANMTTIVRMLHASDSRLLDMLMAALAEGKLCVVDVSQLRGEAAFILSGLILRRIFSRNQEEFTRAVPRTIPTIAVVEEAQAVLHEDRSAAAPYIEWVKEGRKYDLGAMLITQQPGAIPVEILSQGDNWFIFHLLSAADLLKVKSANAHFSDDILSSLLNEPIPGQGVFWSSVAGKPYPVPVRVLSFEKAYQRLDPNYDQPEVNTYASALRRRFAHVATPEIHEESRIADSGGAPRQADGCTYQADDAQERTDVLRSWQERAIEELRQNEEFWSSLDRGGIPYGVVVGLLEKALPADIDNANKIAFGLVPRAMDRLLGKDHWDTEARDTRKGAIRFIYRTPPEGSNTA